MIIQVDFDALDEAATELRATADTVSDLRIDNPPGPGANPDPTAARRLSEIVDAHNEKLERLGLDCLQLAVLVEHVHARFAEVERRNTARFSADQERAQ